MPKKSKQVIEKVKKVEKVLIGDKELNEVYLEDGSVILASDDALKFQKSKK